MEARQATQPVAGLPWKRVGPYRLVAPLAEGGMGLVFRAEHERRGGSVALKIVRVPDEVLLESFRREIYALRSLHHPGIVGVVDDGVWDGQPWYAMPLLGRESLGDYIEALHAIPSHDGSAHGATLRSDPDDDTTPPPASDRKPGGSRHVPEVARTSSLIAALCDALSFMHGQGLVHRDIKPDNIILDGGRPVLVDFGLALRQREEDQRREVLDIAAGGMGTPPYMSPEQIRGRALDARTDLYSLGCILYECLVGTPPFVGSPVSVLNAHLRDEPIPPSELIEGVPEGLDELVLRLLAKEPRERIGYAAEVADALAALCLAVREDDVAGDHPSTYSVPPPSVPVPRSRPYLYRPELAGRGGLVASLRKVITGPDANGALVLIGGQSGVGKTRLATDLAQQATMRGARVVVGRCQQVRGEGAALAVSAPLHPFRPVLQLVADRCRRGGEEDALLGDRRPVLAPYEPALANLPGPMPSLGELPADAARERVFEALEHVLAELSRHEQFVFVVDDLQWADELSTAFLARLDRGYFRSSNLVLVGTYRSDEVGAELEPIVAADGAHVVELEPLGREAVAAMVCDMLAMSKPPRVLIDFLMRESEGNPFFIAEYLDVAVSEGILERGPATGWSLGRELEVDALPLPGGLVDVVDRRLAALSEPARELARVAAVLGRDFDGRVLLGATSALGDGARAALEELRRRRFLEEGARGGLRFAHDKLREAAHAHIDASELPALHRRAGEALERQVRGRDDEALHHAALANHFTIARDDERAITYLERAGEQALRDGASAGAREFFERAQNLAEEGGATVSAARLARWERRLGEASYNLGDLPAARRHLESALEGFGVTTRVPLLGGALSEAATASMVLVRQLARVTGASRVDGLGDRERIREATRAMERLSQVDYFLNRQTAAFLHGLECLRLAEQLGPTPELARAYATLEVALGFVPARVLAARCGRRAQAIAEDVDDATASAYVGLLRGLHAINEGRHRDARGHLSRACELARRSKDVRTEQEASANLGQAHALGGDRHAAESCYQRLLSSAERSHNRQAMSWAFSGLAAVQLHRGHLAEAVSYFDRAHSFADATADVTEELSHGLVAVAHLLDGDLERALVIAARIAKLSEASPTAWHAQLGYQAAAEVYLAAWELAPRDDLVAAARRAENVLIQSCRVLPVGRPIALMLRGCRAHLEGRPEYAERQWRAAARHATDRDLPLDLGRTLYEWGRRLPRGDPRRRGILERAIVALDRAQCRLWRERALLAI